jgi:LuxR family maltose regulon positive regulatory protein
MAVTAGSSTASPSEADEPLDSVDSAPSRTSRGRRGASRGGASLRVVRDAGEPDAVHAGAASALSNGHEPPLAIQLPSLCRGYVARPRLVRRLLAARASLILIAAPAGYGKTSLLCEWAQADARAFAFAMLDDRDNDAVRLVGKLAAAIEAIGTVDPGIAGELAAAGERDRSLATSDPISAAEMLVRALHSAAAAPVLVLDDTHVVRARESQRLLKALAGATRPGAPLVLCSRSAPALPLARLRAARALLTLDAADLAMTHAEATGLLRAAGPEVDRAIVERLLESTQGWPAALYLAARSLRDEPDATAGAERFNGQEHAVRAYIDEEVLGACTPQARRFLVRTSVLERLESPVCDALLERDDSRSVLASVAARNLALAPLDQSHGTYRCHPLVRDVLRAELACLEPGRAAALHKRASNWFYEHGDVEQTLSHAVATGDASFAGDLLWVNCPRYLLRGREAVVLEWLSRFGERELGASGALALCTAHANLASGDLGVAEHWTRVASSARARAPRRKRESSLEAGIAIIEAAGGRHGLERMRKDAERAYALMDETSPWLAVCCLLRGVACHLAGERQLAREAFEEGVSVGTCLAPQPQPLCLAELALMAAHDDDWARASDLAASARSRIDDAGLADHSTSVLVFAISAWVSAHEGLAAEAKRDLRHCTQLLAKLGEYMPWYEVEARVAMARACIRLADLALARALLSQASRLARRMPDAAILRTWLDEVWSEIDDLGAAALSGPGSLTMAELRILRFLPTHLSFGEIGARLHVSTNTVKSQAHAIYRKLGVASRSEAVTQASMLGLIEVTMI